MTTSALSLYQLLAIAKPNVRQKDRFLTVLADHLELSEPDAEARVAHLLINLLVSVETDVEKLPIADEMKSHLRHHLAPFKGISNLSQLHLDVQNAKLNFLKPEHLNGLTDLHLALTGHIERPTVGKDAKELAAQFNSIREEILVADLPESVKRVLLKRTGQIASTLEHFYAFGAQALQEELEGLVGAMVVNPPTNDPKNGSLIKRLAGLSIAGLVVLTTVDASLEKTVSITENANKLIEIVAEEVDGEPSEVNGVSGEGTSLVP